MVHALSIVFLEAQYRARFVDSKLGISPKPENTTFPTSSQDSFIPHVPDGFRGPRISLATSYVSFLQ